MDSKIKFVAFAAFASGIVCAMPTKQEIAGVRSLVAELMAPALSDYKAKTKSATEVADVSIGFAESAKSEATRYLLLRGAVNFYVRGGKYGKAADAVEQLKAKIKDVPPADVANIISSAFGRESVRKAPRLNSHLLLAQAQLKASADVKRLAASLKQMSYDQGRRQYAEALALCGNWDAAIAEFAKVSGNIGKSAKAEMDGSANAIEIGNFWWTYETSYVGSEPIFRERAVNYYRKALADGNLDMLEKTFVEQRLKTPPLPDVDDSFADNSAATKTAARASTGRVAAPRAAQAGGRMGRRQPVVPGLVHRWSFTDGIVDSVGNVAPSKSDNATVENGTVVLRSGSPLEFPAGTVSLAPFTIQVWASATEKGLGAGDDFIFKLAPSAEGKNDSVFWRWTATKKWFSRFGAFGKEQNCYADNGYLLTGKPNLYTLTAEKDGKGMLLKFYRDDTVYGTLKTEFALKKPPALILGGFVTPTYDEIRIYSRALTHAEIIKSVNEGPDNLTEIVK